MMHNITEIKKCSKYIHPGKNLHNVAEDLHSPVNGSIGSEQVRVVQRLNRKVSFKGQLGKCVIFSNTISLILMRNHSSSVRQRAAPVCCRGWCLPPGRCGHGRTLQWVLWPWWWAGCSSNLVTGCRWGDGLACAYIFCLNTFYSMGHYGDL